MGSKNLTKRTPRLAQGFARQWKGISNLKKVGYISATLLAASLHAAFFGTHGEFGSWGEKQIYNGHLQNGQSVEINEIDNRFGGNAYRMIVDGKDMGTSHTIYDTTNSAHNLVVFNASTFYDPEMGDIDISVQTGPFRNTYVLSEARKATFKK